MKYRYLVLCIILIPLAGIAGPICEGANEGKGDAFAWGESDFSKASARESFDTLQQSLSDGADLGVCELHNALAMIEGALLKDQARRAIMSKGVPDVIVRHRRLAFCEFLAESKPCE
mgnify:CR=1 FL=1|jgi:hypothetical protein